jgi:site-specific DNA-cytosine methylase
LNIDGTVDVITGGFPCQDLSAAGRGAGLGEGTRSGLFREMLRLACEIREKKGRLPYIIFENVPRLLSGPTENPGEWFGEFLWALAEVGYDAEWFCITAASIGAPHERERVCVIAYANEVSSSEIEKPAQFQRQVLAKGGRSKTPERSTTLPYWPQVTAYANEALFERGGISRRVCQEHANLDGSVGEWGEWGGGEPEISGVDDGLPKGSYARRNGMLGNAIVPQVFAIPMKALREAHEASLTPPPNHGKTSPTG